MTSDEVLITRLDKSDQEDLLHLWCDQWGGETMVVHGKIFQAVDLSGLIARKMGQLEGIVTYWMENNECELISLDSLEQNLGIGSALLEEAERIAKSQGCWRIFLSTTNDNLRALGWYQKRGFRLAALRVGSVDAARRQKPGIPLVGESGIPIHDELELEKRFN